MVILVLTAFIGQIYFPLISLTKTDIIAITNRMCINPPIVYEVTIPRSHKIISIVAMVPNMNHSPLSLIIHWF